MYATRRPSTRRRVVGTFDVTKETAGAEVGDFPPFFYSRQVGLSRRLFLFVDARPLPSLLRRRANSRSYCCGKKKERKKKGGDYGEQEEEAIEDGGLPPYLQELNDRSVSRTEQKVIYIQFRKSQMSIG